MLIIGYKTPDLLQIFAVHTFEDPRTIRKQPLRCETVERESPIKRHKLLFRERPLVQETPTK